MRKLIGAIVALALVPAVAQARVIGIAGTAEQYTALASLHPSVRANYIEYGQDLGPTLSLDSSLHATAMITLTDNSALTLQAIVAGQTDAYLRQTARVVRRYRAPVFIRLAQEMNGDWFPWSGDPALYVAFWRHVWRVFHAAGATNVRWIWGPDLLSYRDQPTFEAATAPYWPGGRYVDLVGPTMVEFAYETNCEVACRFARIDWLHTTFLKPVWLAETKVDAAERYAWLKSLRPALAASPWVTGVIWSETTSLAEQNGGAGVGDMNWSLTTDPFARVLLRQAVTG